MTTEKKICPNEMCNVRYKCYYSKPHLENEEHRQGSALRSMLCPACIPADKSNEGELEKILCSICWRKIVCRGLDNNILDCDTIKRFLAWHNSQMEYLTTENERIHNICQRLKKMLSDKEKEVVIGDFDTQFDSLMKGMSDLLPKGYIETIRNFIRSILSAERKRIVGEEVIGDWEKEFDEMLDVVYKIYASEWQTIKAGNWNDFWIKTENIFNEQVKSFIRSLINSTLERERERCIKVVSRIDPTLDFNKILDTAIKGIRGGKK